MVRSELRWVWVGALALLVAGCQVSVPGDAVFSCESDTDCGGDGYVCTSRPGSSNFCCKPAAETCNGKDDDCDGVVDGNVAPLPCYTGPAGTADVGACKSGSQLCVNGAFAEACIGQMLPGTELCNGVDDNCNGQVDETFDLSSDLENCGQCGLACPANSQCKSGVCFSTTEISCTDGNDNDGDGLTDCADSECDAKACGTGCTCTGGVRKELDCTDAADNDGDGQTDCADADCSGQSCGAGGALCVNSVCASNTEISCVDGQDNDQDGFVDCADVDCNGSSCGAGCTCANGARSENNCFDGVDNDGDSVVDCLDPNCAGLSCKAAPASYVCDAQLACSCNGSLTPGPEKACSNGADEDCDGLIDCFDADCIGQSCGAGCQCLGSGMKKELTCTDLVDNDGDGLIDCMDSADCAPGAACQTPQGRAGTCQSNKQCK